MVTQKLNMMTLSIKNFLLIILFTFSLQTAYACCAGERLAVFPTSDYLSQNPIFLIEFSEIKKTYSDFYRIYLKDEKGNQIDLKMIEGYGGLKSESYNRDWQDRYLLLKPEKKLRRNATVSIMVESNNNVGKRTEAVIKELEKKSWKVKLKVDKKSPKFGSEISGIYRGQFNSSASGHSISFSMKTLDNNEYKATYPPGFSEDRKLKYPMKSEMLIELTDEEGYKSIYLLKGDKFYLSNGACYKNHQLPAHIRDIDSKTFSFTARLVDFSGNKSKEPRSIKFKIINKKPEKRVRIHNGVEIVYAHKNCNDKLSSKKLNMEGSTWKNIGTKNGCTYADVYLEERSDYKKSKKPNKINSTITKPGIGSLEQNNPNPTSKTTTIPYYLSPNTKQAFIEIVDLSGKRIQTISLKEKGRSQVDVDCSDRSAGVYFYSLIVDGILIETRKMVVE